MPCGWLPGFLLKGAVMRLSRQYSTELRGFPFGYGCMHNAAMKPRRLAPKEQKSVTVTVSGLGQQGEGLGLLGNNRIYVAGALSGETVRATLREQVDRAVFKASLDAIVTPSPDRAVPPCPYYDECGGCVLQHVGAGYYRDWTLAQVREPLEKAGLVPDAWDEPVFIPQATRRRATFALLKQGITLFAGFHGARSHKIVPIDACLLLDPALMAVLERAKPYLLRLLKDGQPADLMLQNVDGQVDGVLAGPLSGGRDAGLWVQETFALWANTLGLSRLSYRQDSRDEPEIMVQQRPVMAHFGPLSVALPPAAFLQPSHEGEAALTDAVRSMLAEAGAQGPSLDLFAGCGTFAGVLLAAGRVHAVELDAPAAHALNNAKKDQALTVEKRNLFTAPLMPNELKKFNTVLLDPPRAGASAQGAELAKSKVPTVIYVSCNPASFRRDALALKEGGYSLRRVRVVDQFIWSAHTELVALFTRGQ
jgi:23S rRNA (uracil1939-C5)-methyltransferase